MQKGKIYTIVGVDSITLSRIEGLQINLDAESIPGSFDNDLSASIAESIIYDVDTFVNNGTDLLVEGHYDEDMDFIEYTDVLEYGDGGDFENYSITINDDNEDDDDVEDDYDEDNKDDEAISA